MHKFLIKAKLSQYSKTSTGSRVYKSITFDPVKLKTTKTQKSVLIYTNMQRRVGVCFLSVLWVVICLEDEIFTVGSVLLVVKCLEDDIFFPMNLES